MAIHRETSQIDGPFATDDPLGRLVEFYAANGYDMVGADADGEVEPAEDPAEPSTRERLQVRRGKAGNGWWTSNMTELLTTVSIEHDAEQVRLNYEVDITGQLLNDVEKSFWRRESQWARRYLCDEDAVEPRDLREDETARADQVSSSFISVGLWGAVLAFLVIASLILLGII